MGYESAMIEEFVDENLNNEIGEELDDFSPWKVNPNSREYDRRKHIYQLGTIREKYQKQFDDFLRQKGVRLPFTKDSLRRQALHDENLYLYPDTYHYQHQVITVQF